MTRTALEVSTWRSCSCTGLLASPKRASALGTIDLEEGDASRPVQEQLRHVLTSNAVRVIDLFREWDEDGDGTVSKKEFRKAMPMLGLEVSKQDINALFDSQ